MKFYSEVLDKMFDTAEALTEAEEAKGKAEEEKKAKEKKLAEERKARAKEVEDALKAAHEAQNKYFELRDAFVKDYGSYHMTIKDTNSKDNFNWLFGDLFKWF